MIVRDEAAMLGDFIRHVAGLWDEWVVVDTGSVDATCAMVTQAGGKLLHHGWQDNFAAARNVGLEAATGRWVIFLDADERPDQKLVASARAVAEGSAYGAATVALRNTLEQGDYTQTYLLRMWRRDPSIRFEHAIHEDVSRGVLAYLERHNLGMARLHGHVEHLGYRQDVLLARDKKARDLRLLRACVAQDPDDIYSWFKLMELARFWSDAELAQENAGPALMALGRTPATALRGAAFVGELLTHLERALHGADAQAGLRFLQPWEGAVLPHAAYYLRRGELHELVGDATAASADFRTCLSLRARTTNLQLAGTRPLLGLARLALARGDVGEALECINVAMEENPRDPEALLALMTVCQKVGGDEAVASVRDAYVRTHGDTAELHGALGETALRDGDARTAVRELEIAAAHRQRTYGALLEQARAQVQG